MTTKRDKIAKWHLKVRNEKGEERWGEKERQQKKTCRRRMKHFWVTSQMTVSEHVSAVIKRTKESKADWIFDSIRKHLKLIWKVCELLFFLCDYLYMCWLSNLKQNCLFSWLCVCVFVYSRKTNTPSILFGEKIIIQNEIKGNMQKRTRFSNSVTLAAHI